MFNPATHINRRDHHRIIDSLEGTTVADGKRIMQAASDTMGKLGSIPKQFRTAEQEERLTKAEADYAYYSTLINEQTVDGGYYAHSRAEAARRKVLYGDDE